MDKAKTMDSVKNVVDLLWAAERGFKSAQERGMGEAQAKAVVMNTLFNFRKQILEALQNGIDLEEENAMLVAALKEADERMASQDISRKLKKPRVKGGDTDGICEAGDQE